MFIGLNYYICGILLELKKVHSAERDCLRCAMHFFIKMLSRITI